MSDCGIYRITNRVNGKVYIGQSTAIRVRWRHEKAGYCNPHLKAAIAKYGVESFDFVVLLECPDYLPILNLAEEWFIRSYDSMNPLRGYNKDTGGSAARLSEETKEKIAKALRAHNQRLSDTAKELISKRISAKIAGVKKTSSENMRASKSETHKQKIREAALARWARQRGISND